MDQNDQKNIKADIDNYFDTDLSQEDRGAAYTQLASMYMRVSNRINHSYLNALNSAINLLKSVNTAEQYAVDAIDAAEIKSRIQNFAE